VAAFDHLTTGVGGLPHLFHWQQLDGVTRMHDTGFNTGLVS